MYNKYTAWLNLFFRKIQCVGKRRVANFYVAENARVKKTSAPSLILWLRNKGVEFFPQGNNQLSDQELEHRLFALVIPQAFIEW